MFLLISGIGLSLFFALVVGFAASEARHGSRRAAILMIVVSPLAAISSTMISNGIQAIS